MAKNVEICLRPQQLLNIPQLLLQEKYDIVDFILLCIDIDNIKNITKDRKTMTLRNCSLVDNHNNKIKLTLWDNFCTEIGAQIEVSQHKITLIPLILLSFLHRTQ
jgi:hypothetical protein